MARPQLSSRTFTAVSALQTAVILAVLVGLGIRVHSGVRDVYMKSLADRLSDVTQILARQLPTRDTAGWCANAASATQVRVSLIAAHGIIILCDSHTDPKVLPLVAAGPEVGDAIHSPDGRGHSRRLSRGLNYEEGVFETLYLPAQGQVLRVGLTSSAMREQLVSLRRLFIIAIGILSAALTLVLHWTTRRFLFRRATAAVQKSENLLQENLIANVSHEFRTPLTSIRGFADAIDQDVRAGKNPDPQFASIIKKETDRMLALVSDLLDLAVIDSGNAGLTPSDLPTVEVTQESLESLKMVYGEKHPSIRVQCNAATVYADPLRLHQILVNLVGNSMKYSPRGAQIEIHWNSVGTQTELRVTDTGPGIPAEQQPHLFKRFQRANRDSTEAPGTGLGLAIVRGWVEAHGGTVGAESPSGKGATFWARFPNVLTQS